MSIYVYELTERRQTEEEVEPSSSEESDCATSYRYHHIALLRRRPSTDKDDTIYLHLFRDHFSYITNIKSLTKTFKCDRCYTLWKSPTLLKRHLASCNASTRIIHPTRLYHPTKNIFEKLAEEGLDVAYEKQFYPFRLCWDIEVYFDESDLPSKSEKLKLTAQHKLASISIATNVPGIESPVCFVNHEGDKDNRLVKQAMDHMMLASKTAYEVMYGQHHLELSRLELLMEDALSKEEKALEAMCSGDADST